MTTKLSDGGRQITKPITVISNDSQQPRMVLRITGRVVPFVKVEPERVILNGRVGEPISRTVRITPEADEPFHVVGVSALRGVEIEYRLEEIASGGKKAWALHVSNKKQTAGRFYDKIMVKVDSSVVDAIPIIVSGNIEPDTEAKQ